MIQRAIIAGLTSTGVHVADLRISPAAVTRHVLKTQGLQAGIHVGRSSVDPEVIHVRVFESPGNQMTLALQKEVEKHFSRQELRRATFAEVGETTYPARVQDSYAQDILDCARRRVDPPPPFPRGGRLRLLACCVHAPARARPARRRGDRRARVLRRGRDGGGARADRRSPDRDRRSRRSRSRSRPRRRAAARSSTSAARRCRPISGFCSSSGCSPLPAARGRSRCRSPPPVSSRARRGLAARRSSARSTRSSELTRAATEDGVVLAAAPTGGFVFPDVVPGYDAVTALCKLLELLATQERPLSQLVAELPRPTLVHRELPCPWGRKGLVMRLLNEQLATRRLDLMDGVKAYDDRGWVQVLPDPDEPLVHLYAEGRDRGAHAKSSPTRSQRSSRRSCRETPQSSEPWSKPQAEVDPSAALLLESVVLRRKVPESSWTRSPILPLLSDDDLESSAAKDGGRGGVDLPSPQAAARRGSTPCAASESHGCGARSPRARSPCPRPPRSSVRSSRGRATPRTSTPTSRCRSFRSLSDDELRSMILALEREEDDISLHRRILHGRIDILRAERERRRRGLHLDPDELGPVLGGPR